jgi:hypothetical protein
MLADVRTMKVLMTMTERFFLVIATSDRDLFNFILMTSFKNELEDIL